MLAYRIEGIIGESLCKDENDRNAVAEMKHKYANRSEVFNNRFGKNAYIFIADTSEGSITLGAFVTDLQKISAIVDSYAQHIGNTNDRYCHIRSNIKEIIRTSK